MKIPIFTARYMIEGFRLTAAENSTCYNNAPPTSIDHHLGHDFPRPPFATRHPHMSATCLTQSTLRSAEYESIAVPVLLLLVLQSCAPLPWLSVSKTSAIEQA